MNEKESLQDTIRLGFYRIHTSSGGTKLTNGEEYRLLADFAKASQHFEGRNVYTLDKQPDEEPWPYVTLTVDFSKPYGKIPNEPLLNIAPPPPIKSEKNDKDTALLWTHLENLCGHVERDVKEWVKDWLADIFQNSMSKPGTALTFRSDEGTGKGLFWDVLMNKLLGKRHIQTANNIVGAKFNNDAKNRLLIHLNEGSWTKDIGKIKSFITDPTFQFEGKGKDRVTLENHARLVLTTNMSQTVDNSGSRRFCMLNPVKEDYCSKEYFEQLGAVIDDESIIKKFLYELENRKINHNLRIIPKTEEYINQQELSRDYYDIWLNDVLNDDNYKTKEGAPLWIEVDEDSKICKAETAMADYNKMYKKEPKLFQKIKNKTQKFGYELENPTKRDKEAGATIRVWKFKKNAGGKKNLVNVIHDFISNAFNSETVKRNEYPAPPPNLKVDIPDTQNSIFSGNSLKFDLEDKKSNLGD
jgi:hypothetical protein